VNIPSREPQPSSRDLPRVLGVGAALGTIVGSVIGSGIFIVPASVARQTPAMGPIFLAWVLGGLFSLAGVLTLAELAAMLPRAGGPYVYLKEAYGPLPAFLFGWTEFLIIRSGSMATLAAAFSLYFAQAVPAPGTLDPRLWQMFAAVSAIAVVAVVNVLGTRWGGRVQVVGTALKVGALAAMIALPWVLGKADFSHLSPVWPESSTDLFTPFMVGMVGVLWTYDGWVNTANLAEEIKEPGRNLPRAIIGGMLVLIALYLLMTLAYHLVLPMDEIRSASTERGSPRAVSADFFRALLGAPGGLAISLVVMASTFISLNGNSLSGPRAYFALARDGLFPEFLCRIHPRFQTPSHAVEAQAVWAIVLTVAGSLLIVIPPPSTGWPDPVLRAWRTLHHKPVYDVLYTYVIFGATIFYMLSIISVFVLRRSRPNLERPYRTWGYPWTPLIYVVGALILLVSIYLQNPSESVAGLAIVFLGVPAYYLLRRTPDPETPHGG
jgi:APA family basic amino acid/polyamine antiporter